METHENNYPNRRKPWVAVFLSLVMVGLGHVYCGSILSGIVIMAVMAVFSLACMVGMMLQSASILPFFAVMWGVNLLVTVFVIIDVYRRARRTRYDYKRKDYNHWVIYLALVWIASAGTLGYTAIVKKNICNAFRITANSMAPTISFGDRALASIMAYTRNDPQHGDVVLFKDPKNRRIHNIKRIIALAGDTLEVRNGQLLINGQALKREWARKETILIDKKNVEGDIFWETNDNARYQVFISEQTAEIWQNFGPVTVPPYHCFVMGDNRNWSNDSRAYGTLSLGAIKGKFHAIYWPYENRATLNAQE